MSLNKKQLTDEEIKQLHLADAKNVLEYLKTAKNNTDMSEGGWNNAVKARTEHVNAFIEYLNKDEKDIEHFK